MNVFIKNLEKITLDQDDLAEIAKPVHTKYIELKDIVRHPNIEGVFGGTQGVFIFLEIKSNEVGHWVCVFKQGGKIHYWDPYGKTPGVDMKLIGDDTHRQKFVSLMKNTVVNKYSYQKMSSSINTCGRWCALRIRLNCLSPTEFHRFIKSSGEIPDELVCLLTGFVSPKKTCKEMFDRTGVMKHIKDKGEGGSVYW